MPDPVSPSPRRRLTAARSALILVALPIALAASPASWAGAATPTPAPTPATLVPAPAAVAPTPFRYTVAGPGGPGSIKCLLVIDGRVAAVSGPAATPMSAKQLTACKRLAAAQVAAAGRGAPTFTG